MKIISSKVHGTLDYLVGFVLILSPWLFSFASGGMKMYIPIVLGIAAVFYSIVTNYELGVFKIVPFKIHLLIDTLSGILLASSPWIFGFEHEVYLPHLVFGLLELIVVLLTDPRTSFHTANANT